jgi:CheY-like chemotaxis protein
MSKPVLMVVEDDALQRELTATLARRNGSFAKVEEAQRPEDVLERLNATPRVDIVLCDLRMPSMSGLELATRVLSDAKTAPRVFALFSNSPRPGDRNDALVAGCTAFYSKPVGLFDLDFIFSDLIRAWEVKKRGSKE